MTSDAIIEEIRSVLDSDTRVSANRVLQWMRSGEMEVQAAIVTLLSDYADRINPPLPNDTVFQFCLSYSRRSLLENPPDGEFVANRTVEGHALQNWLKILWENRPANIELIEQIKRMVTDLYKSGDGGVKYAIETAFLEHLFENSDLADYFSDWGTDPLLKDAYDRAREWATDMDNSDREEQ